MDLLSFPYPSRRVPIVGHRGIVATSQPLAALAGLRILQDGGNAVDAIIATATMLAVVEPTSNGIGADAFALVWDGQHLHGLNGSGRAAAALNPEVVRAAGYDQMPDRGWMSATVPGAPRAWSDLHRKFGRLSFEKVLAPAIDTAATGFAVSPITARGWRGSAKAFQSLSGPEFAPYFDTFTRDGHAPEAGEIWQLPDHAATLRRIARTGSDDFYRGETAARLVEFSRRTGGYFSEADLAGHTSTWVEPIGTSYRGYEVWEIPPNGQGLAALTALNILEGFDLPRLGRDSVEAHHLQIEAMKLAFADAHRYIADPEHAAVPTRGLLDKAYAAQRRALIGETARPAEPGTPPTGGTVYLCAADGDGMMVSYIQSNYKGFGSGIVVPGTGVALQDRGAAFRLDPSHPNVLAPGKRPYHTIIPAFLTRDGQPVGPFGVMGGHMQPQGHLQMALNTIDWGLNPQASLDAPRWQVSENLNQVLLEQGVPSHIVQGLIRRGHQVSIEPDGGLFGKGQLIWRTAHGSLVAGSEPRADGCAVGY
ncbi:MAG TPA: gamma-glutamyltransferase family protein [Chloroflexota bacterium]|nr:gamma-glutamyltransferase family protein [Chloroflexota bacterium]